MPGEKSEERNWKDLVWMANLEGSDCEREPRKWSRIDCFNGEELRMAQEREYFAGEEQTCEDTISSVWDLMAGLASASGAALPSQGPR